MVNRHGCIKGLNILAISALAAALAGCGGGGGGSSQAYTDQRGGLPQTNQRSVSINTYNTWHMRSDNNASPSEITATMAKSDHVVLSELMDVPGGTPDAIRAINPNAKVYRLYDLMCKNPWDYDWSKAQGVTSMQTPITKAQIDENDWWLRDGNGNIVKDDDVGLLLDVGKPGYKEAFVAGLLERVEGKGFDGIVFDYVWADIEVWIGSSPRPAAYPTDQVWFEKAWQPFLNYVVDSLHQAGYRVIGNSGQYNTARANYEWTRCKFDGAVYERWATPWASEGKQWYSGADIEKRINAFATDPVEVWVADFGLKGSDPEYGRKQALGLALYYIALPAGNQSRRSYHHIKSGNVYWEAIWDLNIGTPVGTATKMAGKYFWSRKYTNGVVLFNYDATYSVTYTLDGVYRDVNGNTFSGPVVLKPHTAMILATGATTMN